MEEIRGEMNIEYRCREKEEEMLAYEQEKPG